MINEEEVVRRAARETIKTFLESRTCFDVIRPSGKVVVFETKIPIQLAFYALLEHEMTAAPIWDSQRREFAGLMTITDFVDVLRYYHDTHGKCGAAIEILASRSLAQVLEDPGSGAHFKHALETVFGRESQQPRQRRLSSADNNFDDLDHHSHDMAQDNDDFSDISTSISAPLKQSNVSADGNTQERTRPKLVESYGSLVCVDADANLHEACELMRRRRRRFLPIVAPDECGVLAVITHVDILRFFVDNFRDERGTAQMFNVPLSDLGIGTFHNLTTVTRNTPLRDVLQLLCDLDLSSVPVLDDAGKVLALYSRNDITFLAAATDADSVVANLAAVVGDVLQQRRQDEPIHTCPMQATLHFVFQLFSEVKFKRLLFLDDNDRPVGIVSPRDLLAYFL